MLKANIIGSYHFFANSLNQDNNMVNTLVMFGIFFLFSYFILYRPDKKRRQQLKKLRDNLKKGDIVIAMGIRATVDEMKENTVILKQYDGSKIEMLRASISVVESSSTITET